MQYQPECPEILKRLPSPVGSGRRQSISNICNSTSLSIKELRDYWHGQLHQQNSSLNTKRCPKLSSELSRSTIEPWMLWMPTKEEWTYKILNAALTMFETKQMPHYGNEHSSFASVSSVKLNRHSLRLDAAPSQLKKESNSKKHLDNQTRKNESKSKSFKKEEIRRELDIVDYKKRFGSFAVTEKWENPKDFIFQEFTSQDWATRVDHTMGPTLKSSKKEQTASKYETTYNFEAKVSKAEPFRNKFQHQRGYVGEIGLDRTTIIPPTYFEKPNSFQSVEYNNNHIDADNFDKFEEYTDNDIDTTIKNKVKKKKVSKKISNTNWEGANNLCKSVKDWRCSFTIKGFSLSDYHRRSKRYRISRQKDSKKLKIKSHFSLGRVPHAESISLDTYDFDFQILIRMGIRIVSFVALAIVTLFLVYLLKVALIALTTTKESKSTLFLIEYHQNDKKYSKNTSSLKDSYHNKHHVTYTSKNRARGTTDHISQETRSRPKGKTSDWEIYSPHTRNDICYITSVKVTEKRSKGDRHLDCESGRCKFEGVVVNVDPQIDLTNIKHLRNLYFRRELNIHIEYIETNDVIPKQEIVTIAEEYNEYVIGQ